MNQSKQFNKLLKEIANEYNNMSYNMLAEIKYPINKTGKYCGYNYQIEIDLLEKELKYIHIIISLSYNWWTNIKPLSISIVVKNVII